MSTTDATINAKTGTHPVDPYKTQNFEDPPLPQKIEELVEFITQKLTSRDVYYKRAHCIVSGLDLTADKLAGYLGLSS